MSRTAKENPDRTSAVSILRIVLPALGVVVVVVSVIGCLAALWFRVSSDKSIDAPMIVTLVLTFALGVAAGGVLMAAGALLRAKMGDAGTWTRPVSSVPVVDTGPAQVDDKHSPAYSNGMAHGSAADVAVARIFGPHGGDFSWLEPEDRTPARQRLHSSLIRQSAEAVIDAINQRQLHDARNILRQAEAYLGSATMLERLDANIAEAARRNEPFDYAHGRGQVERHIAAGDWGAADAIAGRLCLEHPQSARCRQLWDDTRRGRLHAHIQACGHQRNWLEALAATEEFLERFPQTVEAAALRQQVETIRANVEIEQRKQYEIRFRELIAGNQFEDALRLARIVVQRFPNSPQAVALRPQIALLEQRIGGNVA